MDRRCKDLADLCDPILLVPGFSQDLNNVQQLAGKARTYVVPEGHEIYFSERVMRLACYQPNDRKRLVAPEAPRQGVREASPVELRNTNVSEAMMPVAR